MLNCQKATKLLSESLDRPLPLYQRMLLRMHVWMCRFCSRFEKQLLFMRQIFRHYEKQLSKDHPSPDSASLSPEARARIKKVLQEEESSSG